jgi:hypothetical protein
MKKTIIIIGVILGIVAMALGVYFARKKTKSILTPPSVSPSTAEYGFQPTTAGQLATAKLQILSDQPVFDYWLSNSTSPGKTDIFYLNQSGQIFKIKDGEDEIIVAEPKENLQLIKARADGKMVLIKFGDPLSPKFMIFNLETKIWQPLEGILAAAFSPDNSQIACLEIDGDLMIKDLGGSKQKTTKIISINQKDFELLWITAEKILLVPKPSYNYESQIWSINLKTKTLSPIISGQGLATNWSKDGKLGVKFQIIEQRSPQFSLIDDKGEIKANFEFSTLPDKCLISQPKIYCAVSQSSDSFREPILPDDYLKKAVYFRDGLYQIDISQNSLSEIFTEAEPAIDAVRLSIFDNQLLFINRYDGRLYGLEL